jgi:DNA repair protein RadC
LLGLALGPAGRGGEPSLRIAERLLRRHGLRRLAGMAVEEWSAERGIGRASAARLCAVFELGRRAYGRDRAGDERPRVSRPREAWEQVRGLARAKKEHLVGLYLDAQNRLLRRETISIGSLNTTRTHPREILYPAVVHLASGFILAHNHPSGCLEPSPEDLEFTRAVQRAGDLMGIDLYDHLIVAEGGYTSLRERGAL